MYIVYTCTHELLNIFTSRYDQYAYGCTCRYEYVSMYLCMYVCMHARMYVSVHVCMSTCMYVCMYANVRMYVRVHVCISICMYVNVRMYVCIHVSAHDVWLCVRAYKNPGLTRLLSHYSRREACKLSC